jgi:hypothetical protein
MSAQSRDLARQLNLPMLSNWLQSRRDPGVELLALRSVKDELRAKIRELVEPSAQRFGVRPKDIDSAVKGYVDDFLDDLFWKVKSDLEREIDGES